MEELTVDAVDAQLLLLLDKVGPADEANSNLLTKLLEELEHFRGDELEGRFVSFRKSNNSSS